jgi:hypothetical protein
VVRRSSACQCYPLTQLLSLHRSVQICVRWVTTYDTAMWLKPYFGTTVATVLWDSMTCHSIMKGAELRAIGVTTAVEVFNEVMDTFFPGYEVNPSTLSEKARVQLLRAIGVAIVKKGSMFPTMELLLRHARECWLSAS